MLLTAGGAGAEKCLTTLRRGGRAAYPNGVELPQKDHPGITVQAYNGEYQTPPFEKINRLIESGPFDIEVAKTFFLDQATDSQRARRSLPRQARDNAELNHHSIGNSAGDDT